MERGKIIETLSKTASKEGERKVRARLCVCVWGGGLIFPTGNSPSPYHNPDSGGRWGGLQDRKHIIDQKND